MQYGYGVPASTMQFGDIYQGTASYASPPPTQEQVNEGTGDVEKKADATKPQPTDGTVGSGNGIELATLVTVVAVAFLLIRYY